MSLLSGHPTGICLRDLPGSTPETTGTAAVSDALREASALGAMILQLPAVTVVDAHLDPDALERVAAVAKQENVVLTSALPPAHPDRITENWGQDDTAPRHAAAQIAAGAALGVRSFHITIGGEEDRAQGVESFRGQLERAVPVLRGLVDRAAAVGDAPIVLKTHEETTTREVVELVEKVPGLQVGLSPVNVVARLEDPVESADRIAHAVHTVYLDDCDIVAAPGGYRRRMRCVGSGAVDWRSVLGLLNQSCPVILDSHRASLAMPVEDPGWRALQDCPGPRDRDGLHAMLREEQGGIADQSPDDALPERLARFRELLVRR
jgi:sugar phosphate isomerase/epimerase